MRNLCEMGVVVAGKRCSCETREPGEAYQKIRRSQQRVADTIVEMLGRRGIYSKMYLDDIIIVSPDKQTAIKQFETARQLLKDLGLPEATKKAQEPAHAVTWLGVIIDTASMTLSVPGPKLKQVKKKVANFYKKKSPKNSSKACWGPSSISPSV